MSTIELAEPEIFVFGSNLAGIHGLGAALHAATYYGAERGVGFGPTGNAYAIPTKDRRFRILPLDVIAPYINQFIQYSKELLGQKKFLLTRIGCGLSRYKDEQMAPLFSGIPVNVRIPPEWAPFLENNETHSIVTTQSIQST